MLKCKNCSWKPVDVFVYTYGRGVVRLVHYCRRCEWFEVIQISGIPSRSL